MPFETLFNTHKKKKEMKKKKFTVDFFGKYALWLFLAVQFYDLFSFNFLKIFCDTHFFLPTKCSLKARGFDADIRPCFPFPKIDILFETKTTVCCQGKKQAQPRTLRIRCPIK